LSCLDQEPKSPRRLVKF